MTFAQVILENLPIGVITLNAQNIIQDINPHAECIIEKSKKDLIGNPINELFPTLELKKTTHDAFNYNEEIYKTLYYLKNNIEKTIIIRQNIFLFKDEQYYLLYIEDETEKNKLEQDLKTQKAHAEATARLATLGEMAGGIAHEINTPLAIIKLLLSQVHRELEVVPDLDLLKEITHKLENTTDRIATVVRGMRSISRDGSKDPFTLESLKQITEDIISLSQEKFNYHKVQLRAVDLNDFKINCRNVEIGQVLLNFLSNAYDAVENLEDKWVEIKFEQHNQMVQIIITDSGNRIPENIAQKIFNPFFTTKAIGKGTGLGLSISMGIIQTHGGSIHLNSMHPTTQFIIELPIA